VAGRRENVKRKGRDTRKNDPPRGTRTSEGVQNPKKNRSRLRVSGGKEGGGCRVDVIKDTFVGKA